MQQHTLQTIVCIIEHIPLTLWCRTLHMYVYVPCYVVLKKTIYCINIYALMQPTYAGGIQNSNLDRYGHLIPVPNGSFN